MAPQYAVGGNPDDARKQRCFNGSAVFGNLVRLVCLSFSSLSSNAVVSAPLEMLLLSFLWFSCSILAARASVTVYSQQPLGAGTSTAAAANSTAAAYYDTTVLTAPPVPSPAPPTKFSIQLNNAPNAVQNLSMPLSGDFLGFSIEFSVINQVSTCLSLLHSTINTDISVSRL